MSDQADEARRDLEAQARSIGKFDEWFRYAEEIGQQRLGSFLFTASIILAAFATLYAEDIFALALTLSLSGVFFSFIWVAIGTRQGKFHQMLESEIDRSLEEWDTLRRGATTKQKLEQFPIWHVRDLKIQGGASQLSGAQPPSMLNAVLTYIKMAARISFTGGKVSIPRPSLHYIEQLFATRKLLWIVPMSFVVLYLLCSAFAAFALLRRAAGAG
jgi:hypothetical protein